MDWLSTSAINAYIAEAGDENKLFPIWCFHAKTLDMTASVLEHC